MSRPSMFLLSDQVFRVGFWYGRSVCRRTKPDKPLAEPEGTYWITIRGDLGYPKQEGREREKPRGAVWEGSIIGPGRVKEWD